MTINGASTHRAIGIAFLALLLFVGTGAAAKHLQPESSRDVVVVDESFSVRPGEHLDLRSVHSDVYIETTSGSEARVRITLGSDSERARRFYEHLNYRVEKSDRSLTIAADPQGSWNGSPGGADIKIYVRIPEVFDVSVGTRHGDVEVAGLKGALRFEIAHGDLETGPLAGTLLMIEAAHGDIDIARSSNEKIRLAVQHGDVEVGDVTAMDAEIALQHGDLQMGDVTASEVTVETAHGDVDIDRLDGYPRIKTSHGDVDVRLANARGGLFRSDFGDIEIASSSSDGLNVDLTGSDIEIDTPLRFQGRQERGRIKGTVNGGGPTLAVESPRGDIRIRSSN